MFKGIIPAVKDREGARLAAQTGFGMVFLLAGEILDLEEYISMLQQAGKKVLVHFDLVAGLGRDGAAVRYVAQKAGADGIVSSRANIINIAREQSLLTVQRLFVLDSAAVETGLKVIAGGKPDAVEVLPGLVLPKVIDRFRGRVACPLIAGGLLQTVDDVEQILAAGAVAVSSSNQKIWKHFDGKV